jgi:hypothetical protein
MGVQPQFQSSGLLRKVTVGCCDWATCDDTPGSAVAPLPTSAMSHVRRANNRSMAQTVMGTLGAVPGVARGCFSAALE